MYRPFSKSICLSACFVVFVVLLSGFTMADIVVVNSNYDNAEPTFRDRELVASGTATGLDSNNVDIILVMVAVEGPQTLSVEFSDGFLPQNFSLLASANQGETSAYLFWLQNPNATTNGSITVVFDGLLLADWSATSMALRNTTGSAFTVQTASNNAVSDSITYDYGTPFGDDTTATLVEFAHVDGDNSLKEGETPANSSWVSGQQQAQIDLNHPDTFSWSSATETVAGSTSVETNMLETALAPPSTEEIAVVGAAFITVIPEPASSVLLGLLAVGCLAAGRRRRN